ncbi:hypothetical protein SDJN03_30212, partial [Cucurbita argyrosperma subsp. sororia]
MLMLLPIVTILHSPIHSPNVSPGSSPMTAASARSACGCSTTSKNHRHAVFMVADFDGEMRRIPIWRNRDDVASEECDGALLIQQSLHVVVGVPPGGKLLHARLGYRHGIRARRRPI